MAANLRELLTTGPQEFPKKHVDSLVRHFERSNEALRKNEWEDCIARAGKFVEAVLKALAHVASFPVPSGRTFKVDTLINQLASAPVGSVDDSIRLLIPRICRFVYDVASNRGGRHDPQEVDPNEMDAVAAMAATSWILGEMTRFAQKGALDPDEAKRAVESLSEKKYPLVEEIDGRLYFHKRRKSGPDVALLALAHKYPKRIEKSELIETVRRNGFTPQNARIAVARIMKFVDNDGADRLRLLATGLQKAEEIMTDEPE